jgi:5-formaminoimidazole-4-carboxamide-1-beta-D-ribofuranosyl 5'-monophosphate synthetase
LYSLTHTIQDVQQKKYEEIVIPKKSFVDYIYELQKMLKDELNTVEYRKNLVKWRDAKDDEQRELGHQLIKPFKKAFPVLGNTIHDAEEIFRLLLK